MDPFQFLDRASQRDHNFRVDRDATLGAVSGGFEDGAYLHLDDLRHGDAQTNATQTHHRVGLVQTLDGVEQVFFFFQPVGLTFDAHGDHFFEQSFFVGHELV